MVINKSGCPHKAPCPAFLHEIPLDSPPCSPTLAVGFPKCLPFPHNTVLSQYVSSRIFSCLPLTTPLGLPCGSPARRLRSPVHFSRTTVFAPNRFHRCFFSAFHFPRVFPERFLTILVRSTTLSPQFPLLNVLSYFCPKFPGWFTGLLCLPFAFVAYLQRYAGLLLAIFSRCVPHAYPGAFPVYGSTFSMYSK